jgi:hypothetical protein
MRPRRPERCGNHGRKQGMHPFQPRPSGALRSGEETYRTLDEDAQSSLTAAVDKEDGATAESETTNTAPVVTHEPDTRDTLENPCERMDLVRKQGLDTTVQACAGLGPNLAQEHGRKLRPAARQSKVVDSGSTCKQRKT